MSTANFRTQANWPLYCFDDSEMDWVEAQDYFDDLQEVLDNLNSGLTFFNVKLASGYYCGVQFLFELAHYADEAGFTDDGAEYADNESCRYYLDMCLSQAKRKFESERRKVLKKIAEIALAYGFDEYVVVARFSNGETWYDKASNNRARLKSAAIA